MVLSVPSRPSHQSFCTGKRPETLSVHPVPEDRNTRFPHAIARARTSHGALGEGEDLPVMKFGRVCATRHGEACPPQGFVTALSRLVSRPSTVFPPCQQRDFFGLGESLCQLAHPRPGGQSCQRAWRQGPAADGAPATLCSLPGRRQAACRLPRSRIETQWVTGGAPY